MSNVSHFLDWLILFQNGIGTEIRAVCSPQSFCFSHVYLEKPESCFRIQKQHICCPWVIGKAQLDNASPSHSQPRLAPANFYLFPGIRTALKDNHFDSIKAIQTSMRTALNKISVEAFKGAYRAWDNHWKKILDAARTSKYLKLYLEYILFHNKPDYLWIHYVSLGKLKFRAVFLFFMSYFFVFWHLYTFFTHCCHV